MGVYLAENCRGWCGYLGVFYSYWYVAQYRSLFAPQTKKFRIYLLQVEFQAISVNYTITIINMILN